MNIRNTILLFFTMGLMAFYASDFENLAYPEYFPVPVYDFSKNQITAEKTLLGRALFYDPILSKDSTISCASCHSPYNAFAHTDHDLSHGINDEIGTRNAPALFNLAWQNSFMWDGAIHHLDMQALAPISHPKEMKESIENVRHKLQRHVFYPNLFFKAFGDSLVTGEYILKALSQFQLKLISANSKYDLVQEGKATFTKQEINGYRLFQENCNSCHTEPLFSNYSFANNGLAIDTSLNDFGKWMITKKEEDRLLFKIPSLRNLSFSYPYMHDGRFKKLRQVLNHYSSGIQQSKTLAKELEQAMSFSSKEKTDMIAFLLTLDDKVFVFKPEHQFPRDLLLPKEKSDN